MSELGEYVLSGQEIHTNVVRSIDKINSDEGDAEGSGDSSVLIVKNFNTSTAETTVFMTRTYNKVSDNPIDMMRGQGIATGHLVSGDSSVYILEVQSEVSVIPIAEDVSVLTNGISVLVLSVEKDVDITIDDGQGYSYDIKASKGTWVEYNLIKNNQLFALAMDYSNKRIL